MVCAPGDVATKAESAKSLAAPFDQPLECAADEYRQRQYRLLTSVAASGWVMFRRTADGSRLVVFAENLVGWIAQSVEQRTENPCVGGSIPSPATTFKTLNKTRVFSHFRDQALDLL